MGVPLGSYAQIIIGGGLPGGERWSVGHWRLFETGTATPTPADINDYAADVLVGTQGTIWNNAVSAKDIHDINNAGANFSDVTVRWYEGGTNIRTGTASQSPSAGSSAVIHPNYVAAVCTTRTDLPGRSHRGRMYFPATGAALTAGQFATADLTDILTWVKTWWTSGAFGPGWDSGRSQAPVVMSLKTSSSELITSLSMDTIPDTQHGRTRSQVPAGKVSAAFP